MAGTCVVTTDSDKNTLRVKWTWVSHASNGNVTDEGAIRVTGIISGVRFIPDTGGTAPDNLYDVTILDANGVDVIIGVGANAPQLITDTGNYRTPVTTDSQYLSLFEATLTPAVANAGNSNGGIIEMSLIIG